MSGEVTFLVLGASHKAKFAAASQAGDG